MVMALVSRESNGVVSSFFDFPDVLSRFADFIVFCRGLLVLKCFVEIFWGPCRLVEVQAPPLVTPSLYLRCTASFLDPSWTSRS